MLESSRDRDLRDGLRLNERLKALEAKTRGVLDEPDADLPTGGEGTS